MDITIKCGWCEKDFQGRKGRHFCSRVCCDTFHARKKRYSRPLTLAQYEQVRSSRRDVTPFNGNNETNSIAKLIRTGDPAFLQRMGWTKEQALQKLADYTVRARQDSDSMEAWHRRVTADRRGA